MWDPLPPKCEAWMCPWVWWHLMFLSNNCFSEGTNLKAVQFSSVAQSCPTPCDPMNHSTSGLPVHHQLPEST